MARADPNMWNCAIMYPQPLTLYKTNYLFKVNGECIQDLINEIGIVLIGEGISKLVLPAFFAIKC